MKCIRIMAQVQRDMAESTPVTIFAHEFPILQAIHGPQAVRLIRDPERIVIQSTEGAEESVRKVFIDRNEKATGPKFEAAVKAEREKLVAAMLAPGEVDPDEEYARLVERYGRHVEIQVSNVEYVYGRSNSREWREALKLQVSDLQEGGEVQESESAASAQRGRQQLAA
jgi:hypothetical protein